jgi:hypothetical protein
MPSGVAAAVTARPPHVLDIEPEEKDAITPESGEQAKTIAENVTALTPPPSE